MSELKIITNNHYRPVLYSYELTKKEYGYYVPDLFEAERMDEMTFFRYKGEVYLLNDFMIIESTMLLHYPEMKNWQSYMDDSYFSGIVIKYDEQFKNVIVGLYLS